MFTCGLLNAYPKEKNQHVKELPALTCLAVAKIWTQPRQSTEDKENCVYGHVCIQKNITNLYKVIKYYQLQGMNRIELMSMEQL